MTLIEEAAKIMLAAHQDQKRKTDGSPYIVHPTAVATKLSDLDFDDAVVAAALVHDVLEDTDFPEEKLREKLGDEVWTIVKALSEDQALEWEERKQAYIDTIAKSSVKIKAVSIVDKIHNLECLIAGHAQMGPSIWGKFNRGKEKKMWFEKELLKVFKKTWSHDLVDEYEKLIERAEQLN